MTLRTIFNLFGRSPFTPFHMHMERVILCIEKLSPLFEALKRGETRAVEQLAQEISTHEREADTTKHSIRNQLSTNVVLPIDRTTFLELLRLQDAIADAAESVALLSSLKALEFPASLHDEFDALLAKVSETFSSAREVVNELDKLLNSSFGGVEAEKTNSLVDKVAYQEHEAEVLQRRAVKSLIALEPQLTTSSFYLWMRIFEKLGLIPHICEKLAYRMRMTLDLS